MRRYVSTKSSAKWFDTLPSSSTMFPDKFFLYILHCKETDKLYIGYTSNLEKRLSDHNSGRSKYTRSQGKWELLFSKKMESKTVAISFERKLKNWKSKVRVLQWIEREEREAKGPDVNSGWRENPRH